MSTFASLEEATEIGAGLERQLAKTTAHHTMFVQTTGEPSTCAVTLEGSHDGYHWFAVGNVQIGGETVSGVISTSPMGHLASWVRARLVDLTPGPDPETIPGVLATIASMDDV